MRGPSLVVASGDHSSSRCVGLSLSRPLLLRSPGSRCAGSVGVAHGPSCSVACGIFPDQGSNPCPLHWQADSPPLCHQGSPTDLDFELSLSASKACAFNYCAILLLISPSDPQSSLESRAGSRWPVDSFYRRGDEGSEKLNDLLRITRCGWSRESAP